MDSFSLWLLEFGTWDGVPQYSGGDVEMYRTQWLYSKQPPAIKRLMEQMRKEDANYLKNLASSVQASGIKQPTNSCIT